MNIYSNYEKIITCKIKKINHYVRIRENDSIIAIRKILEKIPDQAIIIEISTSEDNNGNLYTEIIFLEEQLIK